VPDHLRGPVKYWLERAFLTDPDGRIPRLAVQVAAAARVPYVPVGGATVELKARSAVQAIDEQGEDALLDAVDATLIGLLIRGFWVRSPGAPPPIRPLTCGLIDFCDLGQLLLIFDGSDMGASVQDQYTARSSDQGAACISGRS
jgi:hypothetical protein